jgi:hypothetical protein
LNKAFHKLLNLVSVGEEEEKEKNAQDVSSLKQSEPVIFPKEKEFEATTPESILNYTEHLIPKDCYTTFKVQCNALSAFISNETDLFKAVLALLKTSDITLQQILDDIGKRQTLLQKVEVYFQTTLDRKKQAIRVCQKTINAKESRMTKLQTEIEALNSQIEAERCETAAHTNEIIRLQQEIDEGNIKFNEALAEVKQGWRTLLTTVGGLRYDE